MYLAITNDSNTSVTPPVLCPFCVLLYLYCYLYACLSGAKCVLGLWTLISFQNEVVGDNVQLLCCFVNFGAFYGNYPVFVV